MRQFSKDLGNVCLAPKGKWSIEQEYERLALVYNAYNNLSYVAKINVPSGVDIENREYWQPMNATGYADNNFINLTAENENGTITAYESIEEAIATIVPINRKAGATLSFYNLNSDRLDRQAEFELWQFNSTDLANWENKDYWNNIYYNWNVFAGWYVDADALTNHVKIPNVGQYAYVGTNLNDALLYQCRTNGTWTNTGIKVRNYISVVVSGNITIGENGNWFSDGEDTGIPATPAVDEQLDNIIAKHESLSRTVQGIAATGGASTATNVTYNNGTSRLNAENAQDAIDELAAKNAIKAEKAEVTVELEKKFDKESILQESGEAEDKVMSQKATTTAIADETTRAKAAETTNAETITNEVARLDKKIDDKTNEINVAKEEALQAIAENEQSAITNFNSQRITPEMLSESTKQLIEASGGGTITNLADDEDLTSVDNGIGTNVLKFANRIYNPDNFSGIGHKILRKNIINGNNELGRQMLNAEDNYIFDIKYDFNNLDVDGSGVKRLLKRKILNFIGGKLHGSVLDFTKDVKFTGLYEEGLEDCECIGDWCENHDGKALFLNMNNLKGFFKKYTMVPDGITDNSPMLEALFNENFSIFDVALKYRKKVILYFAPLRKTQYNDPGSNSTYLFKSGFSKNFGGSRGNIDIVLNADIKFDFSEYTPAPTKEQLINGEKSKVMYGWYFNVLGGVNIIGVPLKNEGSDYYRKPIIDLGFDTIKGNYYEGLTNKDGNGIYSSYNNSVTIANTLKSEIRNIEIKNGASGINLYSGKAIIDNVYAHDIIGDNGISVAANYYQKDKYDDYNAIISNCHAKNCADLGISVSTSNKALILNCTTKSCGNDNISDGNDGINPNFGVNSSFNTGGGFSIEPSLGDSSDQLVTMINCKAIDCYNYGVSIDSKFKSVVLINCEFKNIISTYKSEYDSLIDSGDFLYRAIIIRRSAAINKTGSISNDETQKITCIGCEFNNVPYVFTQNCVFSAFGCIAKNVQGSTEYHLNPIGKSVWIGGVYEDSEGIDGFIFNSRINIKEKGTFSEKPIESQGITVGFQYFCTDKQTEEGTTNGIMIYHKGGDVWVDALGRVVS